MKFEFQLYNFDNTDELLNMYRECFNLEVPNQYFQWKYVNNPAGKATAFVAIHEEQIAAFYGVIPDIYIINGEQHTIYQSMDTMTHPNYQRKGLFKTLANITYEHIRSTYNQINVLGFPGETSYAPFIKKLNWSTLVEMKYLFVHKSVFSSITALKRKSLIDITSVDSFTQEFDDYFLQKECKKPIAKYLNRSLANWRFVDSPIVNHHILKISRAGELIGFLVYRIDEKNRAFLININFLKQLDINLHMHELVSFIYNKHNISLIYTFQSTQATKTALYKCGFLSNPFSKGPFSYRTPLIVYGNENVNNTQFTDRNNWDIQPYLRDY